MTGENPRFLAAGDTAITIELGRDSSHAISRRVLDLYLALDNAKPPGVVELVPTIRSLTVHYDPCTTSAATLLQTLQGQIADLGAMPDEAPDVELASATRRWLIPACYEKEFGPDIESVAHACRLSPWQVTALHACVSYRVVMVGFLPGHPYMAELPPPLRLPRRDNPRTLVPAGSIAIATTMTVIYPHVSPGGWHIIGRTPVRLFDPLRDEPSLLAPGDEVRFRPIAAAELEALASAAASGHWALTPERSPA